MKRTLFQFVAALLGAVAGGVAYGLLWQHIDRFFYDAFGIIIQCDGCQTASLSLLYAFIPGCAVAFVSAFNKVFYRQGGLAALLQSLAAGVVLGGTLSLLAVQITSGATAAVLVACSVGFAAVLGSNFRRLPGRQPSGSP